MSNKRRLVLQWVAFLSFFPYPAVVQFGNTFGVQIIEFLAPIIILLALPAVVSARSSRAYSILVVPILISLGVLTFLGWRSHRDVDVGIRTAVVTVFTLLILPSAGGLMRNARAEWLITPVSFAICIHALVGVWQYRVFDQGVFPLRQLFQNSTFHDLQNISTSYALYVSRPFGLFPEPSAMAAAVGPWVLFLLWYGLQSDARGRVRARIGAAAGTLLILLSQSIYAVFLLPFEFLILLLHRRTSVRKTSVLEVLAWLLAGLGAVMFPILSAGRIDIRTNGSTQGRLASLIEGLGQPFNSALTLFFGVGPGQSGNVLGEQAAGPHAIYSVVVVAFAEGGLIALLAMVWVCRMCLRGKRHGYAYILLFSWVAGIAFTTSYVSLSSVWLFLAMLLDLELEDEGSPHNPDFIFERGRATLDLFSNSAEQGQPLRH